MAFQGNQSGKQGTDAHDLEAKQCSMKVHSVQLFWTQREWLGPEHPCVLLSD